VKIDYLGYIIEPALAYSNPDRGWRAGVIISRQDSALSRSFDAFGVHADEASAKSAALMYAQNLILGHLNDLSGQLGCLDIGLAAGLSDAADRDALQPHRYDGTHLAEAIKSTPAQGT
jgi:hypothetical protein